MNIIWKDKGKIIGKSGDLLLTRRSERRYAERGKLFRIFLSKCIVMKLISLFVALIEFTVYLLILLQDILPYSLFLI